MAPANVSASLAERPAEHVDTAHHRLWSSRSRIPLRNDENHVCAGLERPPRVPVRRSSCDNVPNGQVTGCGLTTQAGSLPSPGFRK